MWVGLDKAGLSWQYVRKWANKIEIKNSPLFPEAWFYHMAVGKKRSDVFLKFPLLFHTCNCLKPMSTAILLSHLVKTLIFKLLPSNHPRDHAFSLFCFVTHCHSHAFCCFIKDFGTCLLSPLHSKSRHRSLDSTFHTMHQLPDPHDLTSHLQGSFLPFHRVHPLLVS